MNENNTETLNSWKTVGILLKNRRVILGGTLLCMAIAAIVSLVIPKVYEAEATLLIMPPKFQTELAPNVLSIPAYQTILEGKEIIKQVIDKLKLKNITFEDLQKTMKTKLTIEETGINQRSYSPVISLIVQGKSPKEAADIANTWAEVFLEKNKQINNVETEESYDFLTEQFSQTTSSLVEAEEKLKVFKDSHDLEVVKEQIANLQKKLYGEETVSSGGEKGLITVYNDLKYDLDTKIARLNRLIKQVDAQEFNGSWIGFVQPDMTLENYAKQTIMLFTKKLDPALGFIRQDVLNAKENLIRSQEEMRKFLDEHKVEIIKQQFLQQNQELADGQIELSRDEVRLQSIEVSISAIQNQLESQDKYITLEKGIPDQALWNHISSGTTTQEDLQKLAHLKVESQEVNPIYLALVRQLVDLQVESSTLKPKNESLREKLVTMDSTVRALDTLLTDYDNQKTRLENQLEIAKKNYDTMVNNYQNLKSDLEAAQSDVDILHTKVKETETNIQSLEGQLKSLLTRQYQGEMELGQTERQVAYYKTTYELLADKVEKAKIAKAEIIENIKLASRAVEPEKRIWPKRSLIVLFAGLAGFLLTCLFAILREAIPSKIMV